MSKSYDELQQDAEARWRDVSATRERKLTQLSQTIANAPDVRDAPPIGTLYTHPDVTCPCGNVHFTVRQWGCVNGVKDKATLSCQRCSTTMTWSWGDRSWLN